ncbi:uncharacterized protein B0H18DRAFT_354870 [Fomitopsis serialis]|uniref:uncharacterized protein n=1 Tax=Fomitopsis serialis TaxID=139415 RepID=UPI0020071F72|nr:uncharacterized protein B0H18DRAFT_354870 [Neoantrodia serialis]KAH9911550.1 hypothetical protein B0H18DRAFT_354870 [Neoantrodia serialis]
MLFTASSCVLYISTRSNSIDGSMRPLFVKLAAKQHSRPTVHVKQLPHCRQAAVSRRCCHPRRTQLHYSRLRLAGPPLHFPRNTYTRWSCSWPITERSPACIRCMIQPLQVCHVRAFLMSSFDIMACIFTDAVRVRLVSLSNYDQFMYRIDDAMSCGCRLNLLCPVHSESRNIRPSIADLHAGVFQTLDLAIREAGRAREVFQACGTRPT